MSMGHGLIVVATLILFLIVCVALAQFSSKARAPGPKTQLSPRLPELQAAGEDLPAGFECRRVIATGGMGMVYEAYDEKLGRVVAIKRMLPELRLDPGAKRQFLQEARIVAALRHPNIVEIYSVQDEPAETYLVFEFVEGRTLLDALRDQARLEAGECLRIVRQIASALDYAHARKVLHRDLKPANIMLTRSGDVKVMDFGIARLAKETFSRMTHTQISGTLAYMSPEQHLGSNEQPASDLYSLAVMVYQMLAGAQPFAGPEEKYLFQKENLAYLSPASQLPGLSPATDAFFSRALATDPKKRFADGGEFTAALESVLAKS